MRAITFSDVETLRLETVADPAITDDRDAIVQVALAGICGSDLHPYLGRERGLDPGTIMGHELVGTVVETGRGVRAFATGDRVVAPFTTSCGACWLCSRGLTSRCVHGQLFGWIQEGRGLHGAQAELVRVPLADSTLVRVPDSLDDDALAILAGDVCATALFAVELASVGDGDVVAVIGCGAVGLLAIRAALARGAAVVIALDPVASRLALARRFGALSAGADVGAALELIGAQTGRPAVDRAIEAVGSPEATRAAASLLRPGGVLAAVGVHTEPALALSPGEIYDRNLTYAAGRCPARRILPDALALAERDATLLRELISHRLALADGVRAYRHLAARDEGWAKVVLIP